MSAYKLTEQFSTSIIIQEQRRTQRSFENITQEQLNHFFIIFRFQWKLGDAASYIRSLRVRKLYYFVELTVNWIGDMFTQMSKILPKRHLFKQRFIRL